MNELEYRSFNRKGSTMLPELVLSGLTLAEQILPHKEPIPYHQQDKRPPNDHTHDEPPDNKPGLIVPAITAVATPFDQAIPNKAVIIQAKNPPPFPGCVIFGKPRLPS
jgi:hypothetical protein